MPTDQYNRILAAINGKLRYLKMVYTRTHSPRQLAQIRDMEHMIDKIQARVDYLPSLISY